jgi:SAM-dependent methyltransferase
MHGAPVARGVAIRKRLVRVAEMPLAELDRYLERFRSERGPLRVLEAGCGRRASFDYSGAEQVVGIDVSKEQLAHNDWADEKIVGDLQVHPLESDAFDLVVCWDVLEHLLEPLSALDNLARAVKSDGIIVLGLPNVASVKGLVTRFTPLRFHIWFFRIVRKSKRAGRTGEGPFPTYLRWSLRARSLRAWTRARGLRIDLLVAYESPIQQSLRRQCRLEGRRWKLLQSAVRVLTLNHVDAADTDFAIVLTPVRSSAPVTRASMNGGA